MGGWERESTWESSFRGGGWVGGYSVCVPNVTFAFETISYASKFFEPLTVALNDSIRRIFTFDRWESVRFLRLEFGYPCLVTIFAKRSNQFFERIPLLRNSTLLFSPCHNMVHSYFLFLIFFSLLC